MGLKERKTNERKRRKERMDQGMKEEWGIFSSSLARRIALTLWQNPASNAVLHVQCCLPLRHDVGADAAGVLPPARQRREDRPGHHRATGLLRLHAGRGREPPRNLRVRAPHQ